MSEAVGRWGKPTLTLPKVNIRLRRRRAKQPHECPPGCEHPRMVGIVVIAPRERANKLVEDIVAAAQAREADRTVNVRAGDIVNIHTTADQPVNMPGPEVMQEHDLEKQRRRAMRRSLVRRSIAAAACGAAACGMTLLLPAHAILGAFIGLGFAYGFVSFR